MGLIRVLPMNILLMKIIWLIKVIPAQVIVVVVVVAITLLVEAPVAVESIVPADLSRKQQIESPYAITII